MFGQPGLQNRTSNLPFILINTDNKRKGRRKDIVKVAEGKKSTSTILPRLRGDEKTDIINDRLYLAQLLTEK